MKVVKAAGSCNTVAFQASTSRCTIALALACIVFLIFSSSAVCAKEPTARHSSALRMVNFLMCVFFSEGKTMRKETEIQSLQKPGTERLIYMVGENA